MVDVCSSENQDRKKELLRTYANVPQFGLVLGAGATVESGVPNYDELALRLLEKASEKGRLAVSEGWVQAFVGRQRELLAQTKGGTIPPDEVVLFVSRQLGGDESALRDLVKKVLYQCVSVARTAGRGTFEANPTLDAILTFCAARPGTVLAPALDPPLTRRRRPIEANVKVGGILTTNYDNLVESAFHTKYRTNPLKPVGRPISREAARGRRLIPVYHIHGYVRYRPDIGDIDAEDPELVIAEDDYFRRFYDPLGFGAYIAMSFLRRFPCLFIGCSMKDKNLRRFLFHLAQEGVGTAPHQRKFALLKVSGTPKDDLTDAVLLSYGVQTIWMERFCEIPGILRDLYTAVRGVKKADWTALAQYRWGDSLD